VRTRPREVYVLGRVVVNGAKSGSGRSVGVLSPAHLGRARKNPSVTSPRVTKKVVDLLESMPSAGEMKEKSGK
jgi:hypothetical protein